MALVFYDVTTLYFETNDEDDLRKRGYSKDHKNDLPQVVIGLFVDKDGYPFDFDFYDGKLLRVLPSPRR
jgi:transposase